MNVCSTVGLPSGGSELLMIVLPGVLVKNNGLRSSTWRQDYRNLLTQADLIPKRLANRRLRCSAYQRRLDSFVENLRFRFPSGMSYSRVCFQYQYSEKVPL